MQVHVRISCKTWSSVRGNYSHNAIIAMNIKYTINDVTDVSGCQPMHYHSSVVFNTAFMVSDVNTQLPVHTVRHASLTSEVEEVPIWKGIPKSSSNICKSSSIISHPGAPLQEVTWEANHLMHTVTNTPFRYLPKWTCNCGYHQRGPCTGAQEPRRLGRREGGNREGRDA